jgi:hypothetical protein
MLSSVSFSNIGNALYSAGRLTATTYGANCIAIGSLFAVVGVFSTLQQSPGPTREKSSKALAHDVIMVGVGLAITAYQGNSISTVTNLAKLSIGSVGLISGCQGVVGGLRRKFGVIPQEKHQYFSTPSISLTHIVCSLIGVGMYYSLGYNVSNSARITALFFGSWLIAQGLRSSIGVLRDNHQWSIPNDPYRVFSNPAKPGDRLRPHVTAIIAGFALVTLLGAQL